jgi:hypothetical protein
VQELHLDDEGGAGAVAALDVEDGELRACHERELLAGQVFDGLNGPVALPVEEVVEQAAEDVGVLAEDSPEDEVVLQVGEGHGGALPPRISGGKRIRLRNQGNSCLRWYQRASFLRSIWWRRAKRVDGRPCHRKNS